MVLLLCDGGDDSPGSLPYCLRAHDVIVVAIDIKRDGVLGDILHRKSVQPKFDGAVRGDFVGMVAAPECGRRTVHRLTPGGAAQVTSRSINVYALPGASDRDLVRLLGDNACVEVCCAFAVVIAGAHRGFCIFETHADRGDVSRPELYESQWADHAPIGLL
eukprot:5896705-Prymnesium_polylepis.1